MLLVLQDLVEYYQANSLADSFPEVNTCLLYEFKSVGPGLPLNCNLKI